MQFSSFRWRQETMCITRHVDGEGEHHTVLHDNWEDETQVPELF